MVFRYSVASLDALKALSRDVPFVGKILLSNVFDQ